MLRPKAFYFFYFSAYAALAPFLIVYFEQLGFSGQQIGILSALIPITMLMAAPLWGMIADTNQRHKAVLLCLMACSSIAVLLLSVSRSFSIMVLVVSLFAFFVSPIIPLGDNAVLKLLGKQKRSYGRIRIWGAVGWGLSAPLVGFITEQLGISWAFYSYVFLMLGCMLSIYGMALVQAPKTAVSRNFRAFLTAPWLFLLTAIFIAGAGFAICGNFVYLRLIELEAKASLIGLALSFATLSELPINFFGRQLLDRFATKHLLLIALGLLSLRLFLYSVASAPLLILGVQILHGFSFSVIWIAGVTFVDEFAPEGQTATAQGLFAAIMMGFGSSIGSLFGGLAYDLWGSSQMFQLSSLIGLGSTLILLMFSLGIKTSAHLRHG